MWSQFQIPVRCTVHIPDALQDELPDYAVSGHCFLQFCEVRYGSTARHDLRDFLRWLLYYSFLQWCRWSGCRWKRQYNLVESHMEGFCQMSNGAQGNGRATWICSQQKSILYLKRFETAAAPCVCILRSPELEILLHCSSKDVEIDLCGGVFSEQRPVNY